ncbi:glycosyltransferase family 2 protein [Helicobacter sp. 11S02629-2]|uniref:glycosyltransferase family 2 protein n=1 Tax=Helicobacter sp. 11S02629-2 TaxID=1476195 RepID=UPI000BA67E87|nr:glycosyltransferase family 2 protein [Helicobacter sp. 11S02629-2]PAF44653.1 hypothetical protein BKH40_05345 [Helicobacter sp. 11S02629-2]
MQVIPLLSICIPTYNGSKYISHNLNILIDQIIKNGFCHDIEILISDNCSTDSTKEIVSHYATKYPDIIHYNRNKHNILFNGNILKCCELARGKYIHFMGDDDFYLEGGLERLISVIKQDSNYSVLILSNNWYLNQSKTYQNRSNTEGLWDKNIEIEDLGDFIKIASYRLWCMSDIVVRRELIKDVDKNIPDIRDWVQVSIALYAASQNPKIFYFTDTLPILAVRLQVQTWLNDEDGPRIYLNNIKTFAYARKYGYTKKHIEFYKNVFLMHIHLSEAAFIHPISFLKNIVTMLSYARFLYNKKWFYTKMLFRSKKGVS